MQAYEGYFENGLFYPIGAPVSIQGRRRVILTVLDEPVPGNTETPQANMPGFERSDEIIRLGERLAIAEQQRIAGKETVSLDEAERRLRVKLKASSENPKIKACDRTESGVYT